MLKLKSKLVVNLNLLKPQGNPEKLPIKLVHWLLSAGRYIFVVVNGLVLIAFITRFKLDADLASKKEAIEEQIPYIESLKPYEILIKETQLKLATLDSLKSNSPDWPTILKKIADQTPLSVKITTINIEIEKNVGTATIRITGQTQNNNDLTNFIMGLKKEGAFNEISLANIGLEQGVISFTINASAKLMALGGKSL